MRGGLMEGANLSTFGATDGAMQAGGSRDTRLARLHSRKAKAWAALVKGARFAIDWADAAENGGRHVVNKADGKIPSFNLLCFSTGPIMNESGGTTPTKATHYIQLADAQGTTDSCRLTSTANNQTFIFYRTTTCPVIPQGKYGMRFRARIPSGGSGFTLSYGLSTGLVTQSCQDLDWNSAANTAATTFETEFTYAGTGDMNIRMPTSGNDMVIDRIQIYYGGLAAIPAWNAEVLGGARKAFCFPFSIPLDANRNWQLTDDSGGAWLLEPNLADKTYTAMTVIHVCAYDAFEAGTSIAYGVTLPTNTRLSTTLTTMHVGFEGGTGSTPYEGRIKMSPSSAFRAQTGFAAKGSGLVAIGQTLSSSGRRMFVNEIPVLTDATSFGPVSANRWHVGAGTTTQKAHVTDFELIGRHRLTFIWDRQLTDTEYKAAVGLMLDRVGSQAGLFRDFHVMSGDSNWTQATGDFVQLLSAVDAFGPKRNLWFRDTSVGGTGIAEVYGNSPYPAAMDPAGRLLTNETEVALAAAKAGRKVCYHFGVGTNDFNEVLGVPNWGTAAYDLTRDAVVKYLLNLHPNISVMEYTINAAGSGSGRDYTSAGRLTINANIRTRQALDRTGRHFLCDIGAHPQLGDQATADIGTYLLEPAPGGIHYLPAGDVLAAAFTNTSIATWRTRMGMDTY